MFNGAIPEVYSIPGFHGATDPREYYDNSYFLLRPDKRGHLEVEGENGKFTCTTQSDLLRLFHSKYNWTFSRLSEIDCLFKCFSRDQLIDLNFLNKLEFGGYQLHWVIGTGKIRLTQGGNTRTSRYLINIAPHTVKGTVVDSLDTLKEVVSKLICLNELIPINPVSPASTTKDLLLSTTQGEFNLFNKLPLEWTRFLHSCHVGPRMETRCLGTIENADNLDLTKAYLMALAECPSLRNVVVKRGTTFFEDAHPGSGYEIKVTVPPGYGTFPPIPVRSDGHILYPHGEFITRVSKPYIDTLIKVGDIPFEILDSVQVLTKGPITYPFTTLVETLAGFEDEYKDRFAPLNLKFHYSIAGHMLHIHRELDPSNLKRIYQASQDYNPVNACAIQAMVANKIWELSQVTNSEAIRVDAVTGYDLHKRNGYKKSIPGLMTFLTPYLKDKPGSTMYRDLIHRDRDYPWVWIHFPLRMSIKEAWYQPNKVGQVKPYKTTIEPLGGNRNIDRIKRVGDLEESRIPTQVPTLGKETSGYKGVPAWIDEYLHSNPQTLI